MARDERIIGALEERTEATLKAIDKLDKKFDDYMKFAAKERSLLKDRITVLEGFRKKAYTVLTFIGGLFAVAVKLIFN